MTMEKIIDEMLLKIDDSIDNLFILYVSPDTWVSFEKSEKKILNIIKDLNIDDIEIELYEANRPTPIYHYEG